MLFSKFSELEIESELVANLDSLGYHTMTPVQAQSIPLFLQGHDLIIKARTGSGKTAAFGIGVLSKLNVKNFRIQSILLCPTRELSSQVAKELRRLARYKHNIKVLTLNGGEPFGPQLGSLAHGAHIVVGTPGRIQEHLRKGSLVLDNINSLVLDEADRMLDMGFYEDIENIISKIPNRRQTLLFSATYPSQIEKLSGKFLDNPRTIFIEDDTKNRNIEEYSYATDTHFKTALELLSYFKPESTLIFCNTKLKTEMVADELYSNGIDALAINGDLEQHDRVEVLLQFANRSCSVLVATDVAARGIDIEAVNLVVNYEIPLNLETYVHRVGRTGRASSSGVAVTLFKEDERDKIDELESYLDRKITERELPLRPILPEFTLKPPMTTLAIHGGKKQKVRAGDILGALTKNGGISADSVGKIDIFDKFAYVAILRNVAPRALSLLRDGKIKGRNFRVWKID